MQLTAIHAKRITVMLKNVQFVQNFFDSKKFISTIEFARQTKRNE